MTKLCGFVEHYKTFHLPNVSFSKTQQFVFLRSEDNHILESPTSQFKHRFITYQIVYLRKQLSVGCIVCQCDIRPSSGPGIVVGTEVLYIWISPNREPSILYLSLVKESQQPALQKEKTYARIQLQIVSEEESIVPLLNKNSSAIIVERVLNLLTRNEKPEGFLYSS